MPRSSVAFLRALESATGDAALNCMHRAAPAAATTARDARSCTNTVGSSAVRSASHTASYTCTATPSDARYLRTSRSSSSLLIKRSARARETVRYAGKTAASALSPYVRVHGTEAPRRLRSHAISSSAESTYRPLPVHSRRSASFLDAGTPAYTCWCSYTGASTGGGRLSQTASTRFGGNVSVLPLAESDASSAQAWLCAKRVASAPTTMPCGSAASHAGQSATPLSPTRCSVQCASNCSLACTW